MSVQRQSIPSKDAGAGSDLETTAELPVLDVAAYEAAVTEERSGNTDTWHMPAINAQALQAATPVSSAAVAAAEDRSLQLETDLRALAENLRDVEERMTRRGERLIELERELASSRAERVALDQRSAALISEAEARAATQIAEAEQRAASLVTAADERTASLVRAAEARATAATTDLDAARAELAAEQSLAAALQSSLEERGRTVNALESQNQERIALLASRERELVASRTEFFALETRATQYLESLQTLEGRRNVFDEQLLALDGEIGSRDAQIADLQQQLLAQTNRAQELANDLAARVGKIEALEAAAATQAEAFAERGKQIETLTRERDQQIETLTQERDSKVATLTRERDTQAESAARERDSLNARITSLETSLASAKADIATRDAAAAAAAQASSTQQANLATAQARIEALERDLALLRGESTERAATLVRLEAERDDQINRFAAAEARAVELERRIDDNAEVIRQLQLELRSSLTRGTELEGDLNAAEEALHRLEGDLRTKSTKLDELSRTHDEWRDTVENARSSLAERDSLIHRLETEAANSAALLGNIQQSIRKFDTSQSGSHEIAPEGAVRLLIRVDGDTEVVHVLGRKTTVGRTPDNDLQIDAKFISRNHAVILAGPNHTIIEDLNSTNGVAVNGKRITRHSLRDGDNLAIGKTSFRFAVRPMKENRS